MEGGGSYGGLGDIFQSPRKSLEWNFSIIRSPPQEGHIFSSSKLFVCLRWFSILYHFLKIIQSLFGEYAYFFPTNSRTSKKSLQFLGGWVYFYHFSRPKSLAFVFLWIWWRMLGETPISKNGMKFWTVGELWSSLPRIVQVVLWKMVNDFEYLDLFKGFFQLCTMVHHHLKPPFGRILNLYFFQASNIRKSKTFAGALVFSPPTKKRHVFLTFAL